MKLAVLLSCPKGKPDCIGAATPLLDHLRNVWIALIVGAVFLAVVIFLLGLAARRRARRRR
jgi:hypothetical protein